MISIIIPNYNNEKYIKQCLESILNQTYKNIEIIIIDDKSNDNSVSVIKEFQKKYSNIILIENVYNVGVGKSRIIGLKYCKGKYITLIDGDDYLVGNDYFQKCIDEFNNNELLDMVVMPYFSEKIKNINFKKKLIITEEKYKIDVFYNDNFTPLFNKIIKKRIFDNNILSDRIINEPPLTYYKLLYYCTNIICLENDNKNYYYYRNNSKSLSNTSNKIKSCVFTTVVELSIYHFLRYEIKTDFLKNEYGIKYIKKVINRFYNNETLFDEYKKLYPNEFNEIMNYIKLIEY